MTQHPTGRKIVRLYESGVTVSHIAEVCGVPIARVLDWRSGNDPEFPDQARLDELCLVVDLLEDRPGFTSQLVPAWLQEESPELGKKRLTLIHENPAAVRHEALHAEAKLLMPPQIH